MASKEEILRQAGLSDQEIKVYFATLSLGVARAHSIAKKAGMLRTSTYDVLGSLGEKGLVSKVKKAKVGYFEAKSPHRIVDILEERKQKVSSILPELNALKASVGDKPSVELFEGKEGLKAILDEIIETHPKEVLQLNSAQIFQVLQFYFPHWIQRRVKAKIPTRVIQERAKIIEEYKEKDAQELRQIRFTPFQIPTATFIYSNKLAFLTMKEEQIAGILIDNADIAKTQRGFVEMGWGIAKKE